MENMLKVNEIFKSIQGEGLDIGLPMVFVRFQDCNLNCKWCDTQYASRPGQQHKLLLMEDVAKQVLDFNINGVCLTGGEPFLQDKASMENLIKYLVEDGKFIDIQTNATIFPDYDLKYVSRLSLSPKLSSSGNPKPKVAVIKKFLESYKHKTFLKFVISSQKDWGEMEELLNKLQKYFPVVVVQPNIDTEKADSFEKQVRAFKSLMALLNKNQEAVNRYNIRLIPQIHKIFYGNQRKK